MSSWSQNAAAFEKGRQGAQRPLEGGRRSGFPLQVVDPLGPVFSGRLTRAGEFSARGAPLRRPRPAPASRAASTPGFALLSLRSRTRARSALRRPPPGIAPAPLTSSARSRSVLKLSQPEGGPGGYLSLVAERCSVREGEAGSAATVGRGKAERIPPPSRGSVLGLFRPEGGPGGYVLLVAERCSVREGEAGSAATVGRGKAERIPPPSRGSVLRLSRAEGGPGGRAGI